MNNTEKCFNVLSKSVAESCKEFGDHWKINTANYDVLKEYCTAFDRIFEEFEAETFEAKVLSNKKIFISFNCMDVCIDGVNHPFFGLIERSESVNIRHITSEEMAIEFVFPSIWDKIG